MPCIICDCSAERDEFGDRICGCDLCNNGCILDNKNKNALIIQKWWFSMPKSKIHNNN